MIPGDDSYYTFAFLDMPCSFYLK